MLRDVSVRVSSLCFLQSVFMLYTKGCSHVTVGKHNMVKKNNRYCVFVDRCVPVRLHAL